MTIMDQIVDFINENKNFFEYQGYKPLVRNNGLFLINQQLIEIEEFYLTTFSKKNIWLHHFEGKDIAFTIKEEKNGHLSLHSLISKPNNFIMKKEENNLKIKITEDKNNKKHVFNIQKKQINITSKTDSFSFIDDVENITKEYADTFMKEILLLEESMPTITSYIEQKYPIFSECIEKLQESRKNDIKVYTIKRKNNSTTKN